MAVIKDNQSEKMVEARRVCDGDDSFVGLDEDVLRLTCRYALYNN